MDFPLYQSAKSLFLSLLDEPESTRARRLEALGREDADLAREVQRLFRHAGSDPNLEPLLNHVVKHFDQARRPSVDDIVADRYRLMRRLGSGGMGEVFLAHDAWLDQEIALKFWKAAPWVRDAERVERLKEEAKLARRVEHPNVCRVFDVGLWRGEAGDEPFLTLEYVPGTDLAGRLENHGSLPADELRSLALQLCSALAAIHELGILHRDLKPANVLLAESGRARLTDFGIAVDRDLEHRGPDEGHKPAGTPGYLAPELLAGGRPSKASDLYALGVVLREASRDSPDLDTEDPVLASLVDRCLETDPERRPASAAFLRTVLEKDDPLDAILTLGEPLSPRVIAGSRSAAVLNAQQATLWWAACAVALLALIGLKPRVESLEQAGLSLPAHVRADRAQALADSVAPHRSVESRAWGWTEIRGERYPDIPYPRGVAQQGRDIYFWYRESSHGLLNWNALELVANGGRVHMLEPNPAELGSLTMGFDPDGRLFLFQHQPTPPVSTNDLASERSATELRDPPDSWEPLWRAAGLSPGDFARTQASAILPSVAEIRRSLKSKDPAFAVTIELGELMERPVLFAALETTEQVDRQLFLRQGIASAYQIIATPLFVVCVLFFARRHWRHGLGDPWGAVRLATFVFAAGYGSFLLQTSHTRDPVDESIFLALGLAGPLLQGLVVWTLYMGCEPWLRRQWPRSLVSWNRLLQDPRAFRRDPLIAGHLLLGTALGLFFVGCRTAQCAVSELWSGKTLPVPAELPDGLPELRHGLASVFQAPFEGLWLALLFAVVVAWSRRLLPHGASAWSIAVSLLAGGTVLAAPVPFAAAVFYGLGQVALGCWISVRYGLLIHVTALVVMSLLLELPPFLTPAFPWLLPLGAGIVTVAMTLAVRLMASRIPS